MTKINFELESQSPTVLQGRRLLSRRFPILFKIVLNEDSNKVGHFYIRNDFLYRPEAAGKPYEAHFMWAVHMIQCICWVGLFTDMKGWVISRIVNQTAWAEEKIIYVREKNGDNRGVLGNTVINYIQIRDYLKVNNAVHENNTFMKGLNAILTKDGMFTYIELNGWWLSAPPMSKEMTRMDYCFCNKF